MAVMVPIGSGIMAKAVTVHQNLCHLTSVTSSRPAMHISGALEIWRDGGRQQSRGQGHFGAAEKRAEAPVRVRGRYVASARR
jgi:hypothetical protein